MKLHSKSFFDGNRVLAAMVPVFPLLQDIHQYSRTKFFRDVLAGLTTALVAIPVVLGYSLVAGLPPQVLLDSAIMALIFAALFNSSRHLGSGPSTTICLLFAAVVAGIETDDPRAVAVMLALLVGLFTFLAGIFKLGNLTRFISRSVIVGFSTGVALLIAANQMSTLVQQERPSGAGFFMLIGYFFKGLWEMAFNPYAMAIGLFTIGAIVLLKKTLRLIPGPIVLVVLFGALTGLFDWGNQLDLRQVSDIGALSQGRLPSADGLGLLWTGWTLIPSLITPALAIAILASLQNVSLAKNVASRTGQRINPNQEMMGLGAGNLMSGVFGSMPNSASFVLTGSNYNNGAATQLSAVFAGIFLALVIFLIGNLANLIPVACLAGILILSAVSMINPDAIRISLRATKSDAAVFISTLVCTLFFGLENAIFLGVSLSLVLFLKKAASPALVEYAFDSGGDLRAVDAQEERNNQQISIIHVEGELFFGASELFQDQIRRIANDTQIKVFILRLKNARHLDATAVFALQQLVEYLNKTDRYLLVSGITPDVERVVRNSGIWKIIGDENIFRAETNPTMSTKRALMRAAHLLQTKSADIRIFYDRKKDRQENVARRDRDSEPETIDYSI